MSVSAQGPKPSVQYLERQLLTRTPVTPTVPGAGGALLRTSFQSAGQIDPGPGNATAGDGLVLTGLFGITVSAWPGVPNGLATFSGAGSLLCWVFNPFVGQWSRNSDLDLDLTDATGFPAKTFSTFHNVSRLGSLINWLASGVTASTPDLLLRIDGFQSASSMST